MEKKWVQRFDGNGPKYLVHSCDEYYWLAENPIHGINPFLLKADYRECDPPERWDVATTALITDRQLLLIPAYPYPFATGVALDLPVDYKFQCGDDRTFRILKKVLDSPKQP